MENNENFVAEEVAENVEQTTEQTQPEVKTYTQEEVDAIVGKRIARKEARIRKEYDRKFGDLEGVLKAGMGKEDIGEITEDLRAFYGKQKGIQMPKKPDYTAEDIEKLANADVAEIIRGGFEEVVEEADRLKDIGYENMTAREKAAFVALTNHIKDTETARELAQLGVTEDVYNGSDFKNFQKKFAPNTPIKDIYDIYRKTQPQKEIRTMGSMKQVQTQGVKDFYSPEEIEKLSEEDLLDPKVWEAVRRSMTGK